MDESESVKQANIKASKGPQQSKLAIGNKPMSDQHNNQTYWKANLKLLAFCLSIWFVVSYGFGIIFVEQLNTISIGGYKLGFWFAQQGSIYVFVLLIFFYAWRMNKLDRQFGVHVD